MFQTEGHIDTQAAKITSPIVFKGHTERENHITDCFNLRVRETGEGGGDHVTNCFNLRVRETEGKITSPTVSVRGSKNVDQRH